MLDCTQLPLPSPARERRAFTDRQLASLKPREKPYDVLDASRKGLMLRVLPTGTKTFFFRYQRHGKVERITVGQYPAVTLRQAYETHAQMTLRLNRGQDPREDQLSGTAAAIAATTGPTVGDLAEEFVKRYIQRERKQPEQAARAIEENILKYWRRRPVRSITRRDGVLLLDKIVDRGAPVMANRVAALLAQMFRFGLNRGIIDATPFVAMPRPGGSEKSRKRKLDEAEIRIFWRRLTRTRLSFEVRTALKLILVTAQRPGEVAEAAWDEFDLEKRIWRIPAARSKNGEAHEVPLNDLGILLLKRLRRRFGDTRYILPSRCWRAHGPVPLTVRALSQGVRDNAECLRVEKFTPHDLRRTAASLMTAVGVPRLHVEKVLNHTIDDVAEIYDRHDYSEEKRVALDKLSSAVVTIIHLRSAAALDAATKTRKPHEFAASQD